MVSKISLFFVFNRGQAYYLMALGYTVKKLDFVKDSMETCWGFEETEEMKKEYVRIYKQINYEEVKNIIVES